MYAHGAILGHHIQNWGNIYIYIYKEAFGNFWDILNTDTKTRHMRTQVENQHHLFLNSVTCSHCTYVSTRETTAPRCQVQFDPGRFFFFFCFSVSVGGKTVSKVSKFVMLVLRRVQYFMTYIVTDLPSCETPETIHTGDRGRALGR